MPPIRPELLDELLKDYQKPDDLLGEDGLLPQHTKALVERALTGELTHHLGYEKHSPAGDNSGNSRNGTTPKTMKGKRGQVQIDVPRDRDSSFEPQLVKKGQTRFDGLDEKIISLYTRTERRRDKVTTLTSFFDFSGKDPCEVSPEDAAHRRLRWSGRSSTRRSIGKGSAGHKPGSVAEIDRMEAAAHVMGGRFLLRVERPATIRYPCRPRLCRRGGGGRPCRLGTGR